MIAAAISLVKSITMTQINIDVGHRKNLARRLLGFLYGSRASRFGRSDFQEDGAMKFHINWGKAIHALLPFQINALPLRTAKSAMRQPGTLARRPIARQSLRLELLLQNDGIAEDSAMIAAVYEAHLSMEKMLAVLAELRGDDAGHAVG
jgi:hypothetical protein